MKQLKVAIVHDWLYGGGAELVVEELHKLYPKAPIYTSYCSSQWRARLDNKVITGYLQNWPFAQLRKFLPLLRQHWFKNLDLSGFDLVISSSGNGEARFAQVKKPAVHVSYTHTPPHFYWRKYDEYLKNPGFKPEWLVRMGLKLLVKPLRKRDFQAAQKVDYFIANSSHIQNDIKVFYKRDSVVIHPPVDTENFSHKSNAIKSPSKSGFVAWGRHVPYKRFDLAIKACNKLKLPLTIIGEGPATPALRQLAGPTITFAGFATKENLVKLAQNSQAFIFPAEEDFGIAPVEALALGLPVIAYKSGGALDYVKEGVTGTFFSEQTAESLVAALKGFDIERFESSSIQEFSKQFSQSEFRKKVVSFINKLR